MRLLKRILMILGALILILVIFVFKLIYDAGYFKEIKPHFAGTVQKVANLPGAEDITIDQTNGLAFISSDDRRFNMPFLKAKNFSKLKRGAIFLLDLKNENARPLNISPSKPAEFHPHGISLFKTANNKTLLFVVNHRFDSGEEKSFVEIFEFENNTLKYLESIENQEIMSEPNDVVAVGERSFYFSNDHYYSDWRKTFEDYFRPSFAYVGYFDGKSFRKAAEGFNYPNGINVSLDGKTIYVAATSDKTIFSFHRDIGSGILSKKPAIYLNTGVDNIELDKEGNLWVGCHPKLLAFVAHAQKGTPSPSQIMHIKLKNDGNFESQEIFLNDGKDYSGSSVGVVYQNQLLIGSVFENGILRTKLPK